MKSKISAFTHSGNRFPIALSLLMLSYCFSFPIQAQGNGHYTLDWNKEAIHLSSGVAGLGASYLIGKSITALTPAEIQNLNRNDINAFDRGATYKLNGTAGNLSDAGLGFMAVAPAVLLLGEAGQKQPITIGVMYFETMLYATALNQLTKVIVKRNRPFTYNPDAPFGDKGSVDARESFYSGHTTAAFASAMFLSTVFSEYYPDSPLKPYVISLSFASALATGILRYEAGKHYPTDIIVGAIVGSAAGYLIPLIHKTDDNKNGGGTVLTPGYSPAGISITILL